DLGRASARGDGLSGERDGGRADPRDARRGTLPAAARRHGRARLHRRTPQLTLWIAVLRADEAHCSPRQPEPQRLKETVPPGQSLTPPCRTGRASTPAAVSTLAAMLARMPDSQMVTTGRFVSTPSGPNSRNSLNGMCNEPGI